MPFPLPIWFYRRLLTLNRLFHPDLLHSHLLPVILRIQCHQGRLSFAPPYLSSKYAFSPLDITLGKILTRNLALSSTLSGLIVTWRGRYRESILFGWLLWAVGLGLFSTLDENSGLGKQIGYALLMGFGVGQTLQPSLVAIQAGVSRRDMAVVTGTRK